MQLLLPFTIRRLLQSATLDLALFPWPPYISHPSSESYVERRPNKMTKWSPASRLSLKSRSLIGPLLLSHISAISAISAKKELQIWGVPPPPFTDFSPKKFLQNGLKMFFFAQKTPDFGPKNRLRIWGLPPSPLYGFFFSKKGVTDLGGAPPPFR